MMLVTKESPPLASEKFERFDFFRSVETLRSEIDTNICVVNLGTLADPAISLVSGDPTFCEVVLIAFLLTSL